MVAGKETRHKDRRKPGVSAVAHIRLLSEPIEDGGSLAELGPISPELALVDPELALAARALLPDRPRFEAPPPPAPALAALVAPAEAVALSNVAIAPSPVCLNTRPPADTIAALTISSCETRSTAIADSCSAHNRVDPTMSVTNNDRNAPFTVQT